LNSLLKSTYFDSGVSLGTGLTKTCQQKERAGIVYIDTPGLSDIKYRHDFAVEIKKALMLGGAFQIFFVITLEQGRIRPDDKTTMKLVLEAAPVNSSYSVIINKLEPEVFAQFSDENSPKIVEFTVLLNEGLPGTNSFYYCQHVPFLSGHNNTLAQFEEDFYQFVRDAPLVQIDPTTVQDIKENEFETTKMLLTEQLNRLQQIEKEMKTKIQLQASAFKNMNQSSISKDESLVVKLKELELQYQQQIDALNTGIKEAHQESVSRKEVLDQIKEQNKKQVANVVKGIFIGALKLAKFFLL